MSATRYSFQLYNKGFRATAAMDSRLRQKVWVLTRHEDGSITDRHRTDDTDTGGIFATFLTAESLRTVKPLANPGRGKWAPTHQITIWGVHHEKSEEITGSTTVNLSRALGPFHDTVVTRINAEQGIYIAPAYPTRSGDIGDTQICVSGTVEPGEAPIDAARREIKEELGMDTNEIDDCGRTVVIKGTKHHLFYATV